MNIFLGQLHQNVGNFCKLKINFSSRFTYFQASNFNFGLRCLALFLKSLMHVSIKVYGFFKAWPNVGIPKSKLEVLKYVVMTCRLKILTFSLESYFKTKVCTFEYKTFAPLPGSEVQVHLSI